MLAVRADDEAAGVLVRARPQLLEPLVRLARILGRPSSRSTEIAVR